MAPSSSALAPIVDTDVHTDLPLKDLIPFLDEPWRHEVARASPAASVPSEVGDVTVAGRIRREGGVPPAVNGSGHDPIGARLRVLFPSLLMPMGLHPHVELEVAFARGYARWLTEACLPEDEGVRGMLYLPLREPEAALRLVEEYGECPRIVGAFVTNAGFPQVHDNRNVPVYAALQERGLVLAFHPTSVWLQHPFEVFDRYLPVWALGYPFGQCVHMINWVLHGMPDRFPDLRCIFYEAGVTWLTFIVHRLDREFMQRPSEAPLLKERPSHAMRRLYYATHPLERVRDWSLIEAPMRLIGVDRFVFASNYPQWDFDTPGVIRELPFLDEHEKQAILSGNARRLFGLEQPDAIDPRAAS